MKNKEGLDTVDIVEENLELVNKEVIKKLENKIVDHERFLAFIVQMLSHEQHTKYVARYKEVFGK